MATDKRTFLSDAPPRPWLLWTARIVIVGFAIVVLVLEVPDAISSIRNILATMPPGSDRTAALDAILQNDVVTVVVPLLLLVTIGFGVGIRPAVNVWNSGGPWFVPMWRSKKPRHPNADDRASSTDARTQ